MPEFKIGGKTLYIVWPNGDMPHEIWKWALDKGVLRNYNGYENALEIN